jgi:hypothetical protein
LVEQLILIKDQNGLKCKGREREWRIFALKKLESNFLEAVVNPSAVFVAKNWLFRWSFSMLYWQQRRVFPSRVVY